MLLLLVLMILMLMLMLLLVVIVMPMVGRRCWRIVAASWRRICRGGDGEFDETMAVEQIACSGMDNVMVVSIVRIHANTWIGFEAEMVWIRCRITLIQSNIRRTCTRAVRQVNGFSRRAIFFVVVGQNKNDLDINESLYSDENTFDAFVCRRNVLQKT